MQPPDRGKWNDQDHEIAHNSDDASPDEYNPWILAFCFCRTTDTTSRSPDDDEDERVEEIPVEDEPNTRMESKISI